MRKIFTLVLFVFGLAGLSAQSLTSIYPTAGHEGDVALSEQIDGYGTHFAQSTTYHITLHLNNNSITGYNVQVVSTGRLTVDFDIPANFPEGTYYLTLSGGVDSFTTVNPVYVVYAPTTSGFANIEAITLNAYPVPASDHLYIKATDGSAIQSVAIISLTGQTVLTQSATGNSVECINLRNFAAGEFILVVTQRDGIVLRRKIVVN